LYVFGTSREWIEYLRAAFQGHSLEQNAHHRQLAGTTQTSSRPTAQHTLSTATLIVHNEGLKGRANTHPSLRRVSDAMIAKSSPLTPSTVLRERERCGCAQQSFVSVSVPSSLQHTFPSLTHTYTLSLSLSPHFAQGTHVGLAKYECASSQRTRVVGMMCAVLTLRSMRMG